MLRHSIEPTPVIGDKLTPVNRRRCPTLSRTPFTAEPTAAEFLAGTLLAFVVLVVRMPFALVEPALWPDDLNYLVHVYENPGEPVWHYVNLAGVKGYISLLPMLEAWAWVHLVPSPTWTPYLFVGSSMMICALAQALPLHPMSRVVLATATQRRLACLLLMLLPVSTIGEATAVAIQHVSFLMIAAWLVAVHVGANPWAERLSPIGVGMLLAALFLAMWSAPTAFALSLPALAGLVLARRQARLRSRAALVLAATVTFGAGFLVFGAVPGPSFLYQGVIRPLLAGDLAAGLLGTLELAWLSLAFVADAVGFDLVFGSEAKLFLGRAVPGGYAVVWGAGAVLLAGLAAVLWRGGELAGAPGPARLALAAIAVLLVAINLAARWEPDNPLAIEGFRYWRWRYFTPSEWLVAALLAVPLAGLLAGPRRRVAGVAVALWLVALNLANQPKYTEFFKQELAERGLVDYGAIRGGEVAARAAGTAAAMRLLAETEASLAPGEVRRIPFGGFGHQIAARRR